MITQPPPSVFTADDIHYMQIALKLASRQLGRVAPNPAVGCVLVKNGQIIGQGATSDKGRPHAEVNAIAMAKEFGHDVTGADAYVTLEPCSHFGKTPPCCDALINSQIKRVFMAIKDPNPQVNGGGKNKLMAAGIEVLEGLCSKEAAELNRGFLLNISEKRPLIALKLATSLDGKIALHNGQSQWITGEEARRHGNYLRSKFDAIMIGAGTLRKDNPQLTCRIAGLETYSPRPIVILGMGDIPPNTLLYQNPEILIYYPHLRNVQDFPLAIAQDKLIAMEWDENAQEIPLYAILQDLSQRGITRLLIEGGASLITRFYKESLFDELYHYQSPIFLGQDAKNCLGDLSFSSLVTIIPLALQEKKELGKDNLFIYHRHPVKIINFKVNLT